MKRNAVAPDETATTPSPASADERDRRLSKLDDLPLRLLRCRDVEKRTGLSRSTIWRLEHSGAFPKRVQVSANAVAWLEDEVVAWIRSRVNRVAV